MPCHYLKGRPTTIRQHPFILLLCRRSDGRLKEAPANTVLTSQLPLLQRLLLGQHQRLKVLQLSAALLMAGWWQRGGQCCSGCQDHLLDGSCPSSVKNESALIQPREKNTNGSKRAMEENRNMSSAFDSRYVHRK